MTSTFSIFFKFWDVRRDDIYFSYKEVRRRRLQIHWVESRGWLAIYTYLAEGGPPRFEPSVSQPLPTDCYCWLPHLFEIHLIRELRMDLLGVRIIHT